MCTWCAIDPPAYSEGLCRPCYAYRAKYGHLPAPQVLDRRMSRRVTGA